MGAPDQWTESDIGDQSGRVVVITGANSGIGFETSRALVEHGATVVLGCRSVAKAEAAVARIDPGQSGGRAEIVAIDLADLESVERAAHDFVARFDRLDVLVNNAGLMATPEQRTAQGFEMQFGVNHLGHFALTAHLLPTLTATGTDERPSRIVSISSQGHRPGKIDFDDLNSEHSYSPWPAYFQSKLANLLFTRELDRRLTAAGEPAIAVAAHPGASSTNLGHENPGGVIAKVRATARPLFDRLLTQSAAMGALPTLRAAVDPDVVGGDYFGPDGFGEQRGHPVKVGRSSRAADDAASRRLWDASVQLTGVTPPV